MPNFPYISLHGNPPDLPIKAQKKQQIFFRLTACVPLWGRRVFSFQTIRLTVKPKLKLTFYEFCLDVVLHVHVEMPVDMGTITDISGVVGKHFVHGFRVALMRLYYRFAGEQFAYGKSPPFPAVSDTRQAVYAALRYCMSARTACRFPFAYNAGNSKGKFLPASAGVAWTGRRQGRAHARSS